MSEILIFKNKKNEEINNYIIEISKCKQLSKKKLIKLKYIRGSKEIKIFENKFIKRNKKNCKIIINNKKNELKEKVLIEKEKKTIKIKLELLDHILYSDSMFKGCYFLKSFEIAELKIKCLKSMENFFYGCTSLDSLSGISNWD